MNLPFTNEQFEIVTCRRAAHNFTDIGLALAEMRRVLRPGGRLVIDDRSVPEDDEADRAMNHLDELFDRSHVREYRPSEWKDMLVKAGFQISVPETYRRHLPLTSITEYLDEGTAAKIFSFIKDLQPRTKYRLGVEERDGDLWIDHFYVMVSSIKP
jgi:ubiquinone/menaquinone biosynthesis C-methylase UbiE